MCDSPMTQYLNYKTMLSVGWVGWNAAVRCAKGAWYLTPGIHSAHKVNEGEEIFSTGRPEASTQ